MELSAALPTFVVTLREGVEAALVVGIVLACLKAAGQQALYGWVYGGIGVGILGSILIGFLLGGTLQGLEQSDLTYAPVIQEFLAAGFGVLAIILLSWMLVWMTQQAKSLKGEVQQTVQKALQEGGGWQVFTLIFVAVLREGFETVLFIAARFAEGVGAATVGAVAGITGATLIGFALFRLGIRINLRLFFQVMGIFLLLIVGGLAISVFRDIDKGIVLLSQIDPQYASWCLSGSASCVLGAQLWDLSHILPDHAFPGIVFKALLGYREKLYLVQGIAYIALVTTVGSFYWRSLGGNATPAKGK